MLLDLQQVRQPLSKPSIPLSWRQQFREQIIAQTNHILESQNKQAKHNYHESQSLNKLIEIMEDQDETMPESRAFKPIVVEMEPSVYHEYSNFVPLRSRCYDTDGYGDCEKEFPYGHYVAQNNYKQKEIEFWADVKSCMGSVRQFRTKMCQKYNPQMDFTQKVEYYLKLLRFGTKVLRNFPHKWAMIYNLSKVSQLLMGPNIQTVNNISITLQKQQQISIRSLSYTMKTLYCPICFLYDCPIHDDHHTYINSDNNLMFVSPKNKISRPQHTQNAIRMLSLNYWIDQAREVCSELCYLREYDGKRMERQTCMSDLTKSMIEIGVHMFSYDPCMIRNLFPQSQVTCRQICKYLETELNIHLRINNKMYSSEYESLAHEESKTKVQLPSSILAYRRRKRKLMRPTQSKGTTKSQIAICVHHFLDQPSTDQDCRNCICANRGYCTSACLCSQNCPIMKIGCKCKKTKGLCSSASCPCYSNNQECDDSCGKCCSQSESACLNRQIQMRKMKRVLIGESSIPNAGLGLFAGERIGKNSLVTVYLGEKVSENTSQFRQQLRRSNSFYNFQQHDTILDSRFIGNESRFINHNSGKNTNLIVRIVKSQGEFWTAFYANRDIEPHSQLFFNYDGDGQIAKHHADKYPFILH